MAKIQILIEQEVHEQLSKLKIIPRESFNAVIKRLLNDSTLQKGIPSILAVDEDKIYDMESIKLPDVIEPLL